MGNFRRSANNFENETVFSIARQGMNFYIFDNKFNILYIANSTIILF